MSQQLESHLKAEQISVFLENRAGQLGKVIDLLAEAEINIRGISLADTSDFGILRLIVSLPQTAGQILKKHGFTTGSTAVVALELVDAPGSLNHVLRILANAHINLEYMYACARREPDLAVMIFRFDKVDEAITILQQNAAVIIPPEQLYDI